MHVLVLLTLGHQNVYVITTLKKHPTGYIEKHLTVCILLGKCILIS